MSKYIDSTNLFDNYRGDSFIAQCDLYKLAGNSNIGKKSLIIITGT